MRTHLNLLNGVGRIEGYCQQYLDSVYETVGNHGGGLLVSVFTRTFTSVPPS